MNCREFLIEFEERPVALSEAAVLHLRDCPGCEKTSVLQTQIWQMIEALNPIGAPKDFDFHVKARIAKGRPADVQPRFVPILRYVLPLSVVVLLVSLIVFNSLYFSNNLNDNQIAVIEPTSSVTENPSSINLINSEAIAADTEDITSEQTNANASVINAKPTIVKKQPEYLAVSSTADSQEKTPRKKSTKVQEGSREMTVTQAPVNYPEGFSPSETNNVVPVQDTTAAISLEQIEEFLGIEVVFENGKRKVVSVITNKLADRAGVKVGDVIEELNGKKLSGDNIKFKSIEARSLTVIRASERIEITLNN